MKLYEPGQPKQAALVLGVIAAAVAVLAGGTRLYHQVRTSEAQHNLSAARAAMQHLAVPAEYSPFTSGCHWYRCYSIEQPSYAVAPTLAAVFRSTGARPISIPHFVSDSVARVFYGCRTVTNPEGKITTCTLTGYLHGQPVILFLQPLWGGTSHRDWLWERSEVDVSFDPTKPAGSA